LTNGSKEKEESREEEKGCEEEEGCEEKGCKEKEIVLLFVN